MIKKLLFLPGLVWMALLGAYTFVKIFILRNILSGTDRKNQSKLPTLVGALTFEAHPIGYAVGG